MPGEGVRVLLVLAVIGVVFMAYYEFVAAPTFVFQEHFCGTNNNNNYGSNYARANDTGVSEFSGNQHQRVVAVGGNANNSRTEFYAIVAVLSGSDGDTVRKSHEWLVLLTEIIKQDTDRQWDKRVSGASQTYVHPLSTSNTTTSRRFQILTLQSQLHSLEKGAEGDDERTGFSLLSGIVVTAANFSNVREMAEDMAQLVRQHQQQQRPTSTPQQEGETAYNYQVRAIRLGSGPVVQCRQKNVPFSFAAMVLRAAVFDVSALFDRHGYSVAGQRPLPFLLLTMRDGHRPKPPVFSDLVFLEKRAFTQMLQDVDGSGSSDSTSEDSCMLPVETVNAEEETTPSTESEPREANNPVVDPTGNDMDEL